MATKRTAEVLLGAFQDEMVTRRQFDVKNSKDEVIEYLSTLDDLATKLWLIKVRGGL